MEPDVVVDPAPGEGEVSDDERDAAFAELCARRPTGYSTNEEDVVREQRARVRAIARRLNDEAMRTSLFDVDPLASFTPADRTVVETLVDVKWAKAVFGVFTQRRGARPHATLRHWLALAARLGLPVADRRTLRVQPSHVPSPPGTSVCRHAAVPILVVFFQLDLDGCDAKVRFKLVFHALDPDAADDATPLCLRAYHFCANVLEDAAQE